MRGVGLAIGFISIFATCASAQESKPSSPLTIKVHPSGYEVSPDEAITRQKRLAERMSKNDFLFRSICISCGDSWKHNSYAPFEPMSALGGQKTAVVIVKPSQVEDEPVSQP